jgi:6-pyruvoyltetrahydropterin/6-carboxytetrahydropterin synthase
MPFEISTTRTFSAAHALRLYDNTLEPIHGHNWRVRVTVASRDLDPIGVVMDFHELERLVDQIVTPWHNRHLNDCPPFAQGTNPSAENVALHIARALKLPQPVVLIKVQVWETDANRATYLPE